MNNELMLQRTRLLGIPDESLLRYLELLTLWNKAYNLTAVRDPKEMITRHILDSLAIVDWVRGERLIDVGTGAGLPGIPLALAKPHLHVVLLDSKGKKACFLREVTRELALNNVEVVQSRVESYHPSVGFDTVVSRAFSEIQPMIDCTRHLLAPNGQWLAMKGRYPHPELAMIGLPYRVETYAVPGLEGERCCVIIN